MKRAFNVSFLCIVSTWSFWMVGSACTQTKNLVDPIKNEKTFKELFKHWEMDSLEEHVKVKLAATCESYRGRIETACFIDDDTKILSKGADVELWSVKGKHLAALGDPNTVDSAIVSPDGKNIITTSDRYKKVELWNTKGTRLETFTGEDCDRATFTPDSTKLLVGSRYGGTVKLYDLHGQRRAIFKNCYTSYHMPVLAIFDTRERCFLQEETGQPSFGT